VEALVATITKEHLGWSVGQGTDLARMILVRASQRREGATIDAREMTRGEVADVCFVTRATASLDFCSASWGKANQP